MTNPSPHRATPEQWAQIERFADACDDDSCLLELRDRLVAAEQRISELEVSEETQRRILVDIYDRLDKLESTENLRQQDEDAERAAEPSAPAGSLVEMVANALDPEDPPCYHVDKARAAILAVADWLGGHQDGVLRVSARWLREEVER